MDIGEKLIKIWNIIVFLMFGAIVINFIYPLPDIILDILYILFFLPAVIAPVSQSEYAPLLLGLQIGAIIALGIFILSLFIPLVDTLYPLIVYIIFATLRFLILGKG